MSEDRSRRIFSYNDGESDVFADPTEIDYQITHLEIEDIMYPQRLAEMATLEDGSIDTSKADKLDLKLMIDSFHDAEPLIREAFRIKPFDRTTGKGLLYEEVIELFNRYSDWRSDIKKNGESQPGSATPTA